MGGRHAIRAKVLGPSSCNGYLRSDLVTVHVQRAGTYPLMYPSNKYASLRIPHERGQSPRSNFTRLVRGNVSRAAVFPLNYEHDAKTLLPLPTSPILFFFFSGTIVSARSIYRIT